jgi:parvulin-like peptidyl-prolyl isomerase
MLMAIPLGACSDDNAGGTGRTKDSSASGVLAVAGDVDITQEQVDDLTALIAMLQGQSMDQMSDSDKTIMQNQVLIYMAGNVLIKNSIDESDQSAAESAKTMADQQYEQMTAQYPDTASQLSSAGISADTFKSYIEAGYYEQVFGEKIVSEQTVTDAEAKAYYDEHKSAFVSPASIELSHILISSEGAVLEDARTSAEAIKKSIDGGEDFAKLAKENSADGSAASGGALGVVPKGEMVPEFEEAGFKLKKGEVSDIVETQFGFHIIKADSDVIPEKQQKYEAVKSQIERLVAEEKAGPAFTEALEQLKKDHPIKYNVEVDPATGEPPITAPETTDSAVTDSAATEEGGAAAEEGAATEEGGAPDSGATGESETEEG